MLTSMEKTTSEVREDFVVILQKTTTKDPTSCLAVIDSALIEKLHSELSKEEGGP
jgi:hypothetical protein